MELHKLPYFQKYFDTARDPDIANIGDGQFRTNFVGLAARDPDWAERFINLLMSRHRMYSSNRPFSDAVRANRYRSLAKTLAEDVLAEGDRLMPWLVFLIQDGHFNDEDLYSLRQVWRTVIRADDDQECLELMRLELAVVSCPNCGELEYASEAHSTFDTEDDVCRQCASHDFTYSEYYDALVSNENARWSFDEHGDRVLISTSDDRYRFSSSDMAWHHVDYQPPHDEDEEEDLPPVIQPYHSSKRRQVPVDDGWTKQNRRWFGVELEVEYRGNGNSDDKARAINEVVNDGLYGKRAFFERDGSVPTGFEIISQPLSLPAHRELWSWLNNKKMVSDLRSHNTTTCGLHVHVSRDRMTPLQIAKIVTFVNSPTNEPLIRAIARRYAEGYCRIKDKKIGSAHESEDRYEAVNLCNSKTIEFRIFKGSLKYESVVSAIEFANAMVEFTRTSGDCSIKDLNSDAFLEFINRKLASETKVLRAYINNRLETA